MKKLTFVILIIALMIITVGCNNSKRNDDVLGNYFYVKEEVKNLGTLSPDVTIVVDKKSGVNYYWINSGYGKSLTPIYNSDGTLIIDKIK